MLLRGLVLTLAVLALPDEAGAQGSMMQGVAIASLVAVLRGNGTPSAKSRPPQRAAPHPSSAAPPPTPPQPPAAQEGQGARRDVQGGE